MHVNKTRIFRSVVVLSALLAVGACSRTTGFSANQNLATATLPAATAPGQTLVPGVTTQAARQSTDAAQFIDVQAFALLSENERSEAASAQFYALQFGRPGAPRRWSGDNGATGKITVGPFVRVNSLDCREFVHEVTVGEEELSQSGTSCREADGSWKVVAS